DGAYEFLAITRTHRGKNAIRALIFVFIILGVLFLHFVVRNQSSSANPYYLPLYPLMLTVIAPYLYIWIIGLLGMYDLWLYMHHVKGFLYRKGLQNLIAG